MSSYHIVVVTPEGEETRGKSEESYFGHVNNLSINFISNGYEITTLVFYF